jgi:hypothetical protein
MQYNDHKKEQTMIYITLHRMTDNTMTTRKRTNNDLHNTTQKDRQYNDHKKEQTMIYITLHRMTCNTMTTRKNKQWYA